MPLPFPTLALPFFSSTPTTASPADDPPDISTFLLTRLAHYSIPNSAPPTSARISTSLVPLTPPPLTLQTLLALPQLCGYAAFLSVKTLHVLSSLLSHTLLGPKRRSWGVQMTLLSAFMRGVGAHHHLAPSVLLIRLLSALPAPLIHPPASEALITPVAFRVRRRGLGGMLQKWDERETGEREITAEWVVSKGLWRRLNAEWKRERDSGSPSPARVKGRVILYLHGGAYYVFNASTHRPITVPLSRAAHARVFAINYRLAPETRFPGPLHDAVSAYLRLTTDMRIPPSSIFLAGDSAGGGLALALAMYLRDEGMPLPAGMVLFSPWVDLTMSSDSWSRNEAFDIVPFPPADSHLNPVTNYLGPSGLAQYLTHPYASPLFGSFAGLPPILVQCGEAEVLRDEGELLAHKATSQGVDVRHEVFEDGVHVFQMFPFLPQTAKAFESVRAFVRSVSPSPSAAPPPPPSQGTETDADALDRETVVLRAGARTRVVTTDGDELAVGAEEVQRSLDAGAASGEEESDSDKDASPLPPSLPTFSPSPPPPSPSEQTPQTQTKTELRRTHFRHPTTTSSVFLSSRASGATRKGSSPKGRARALSQTDMVELVRGWEREVARGR